jgi:hypothetical protein
MYFELFPTIPYNNVENVEPKIVTNLLKRIGVRSVIKENTVAFTKYIVRGNETPENLAFEYYGDAELHWIILLTNDIHDRFHQWPMNVNQFQAYLGEKYTDVNAVHHYEIEQTSGDTTIKINIGLDTTGHPSATAITNFEYEEDRQNALREIKLLDQSYVAKFVSDYGSLIESSD